MVFYMRLGYESAERTLTQGFGVRLQKLMDFAGLKKYGRGKLICEWSGLSDSTASYLFKNDKGPRDDKALKKIVAGLAEAIKIGREVEIIKADLLDYLITGKGFKELDIWVLKDERKDEIEDEFGREAKRFVRIYRALIESEVKLDVDSTNGEAAIKEIIRRVEKFVKVNDLDFESETVYGFIKDMVNLYNEGKLRTK